MVKKKKAYTPSVLKDLLGDLVVAQDVTGKVKKYLKERNASVDRHYSFDDSIVSGSAIYPSTGAVLLGTYGGNWILTDTRSAW